jgi:hypothetical protein
MGEENKIFILTMGISGRGMILGLVCVWCCVHVLRRVELLLAVTNIGTSVGALPHVLLVLLALWCKAKTLRVHIFMIMYYNF